MIPHGINQRALSLCAKRPFRIPASSFAVTRRRLTNPYRGRTGPDDQPDAVPCEVFCVGANQTLFFSTERDYLYVTTAHLNHGQLQQLSEEVGTTRTLLVLCPAFRGKSDQYPNLTVRKIPKQVLARCEWGHDNYSLRVENLPKASPKKGQQGLFEEEGE
jgi:hypothetical protein